MDSQRWNQVERLYYAALEQVSSRRSAFLEQACGADEELRREVESLLAQGEKSGMFLNLSAPEFTEFFADEQTGATDATSSHEELSPGTIIARYRVLERLGAGGMGVIYKARDIRLGRLVALKFLHGSSLTSEDALQRFRREARAASALNHPNISIIHDIDKHEGQPFIVMEYLEGQTLKERIQDKPTEPGRTSGPGSSNCARS
jgi:serine/threonine protein kinase